MRRNLMRAGTALLVLAAAAGCSSSAEEELAASGGRMGPGGGSAQVADGKGGAPVEDGTGAGEAGENGEAGEAGDVDGSDNVPEPALEEGFDPDEYIAAPPGTPGSDPADNGPTDPIANLPGTVQPAEGESTWVLYTAVAADIGDAALSASSQQLEALGTGPFTAIVSCDTGAAAALNVPETHYRVGLYFGSQGDAQRFASEYGGPSVGVAQVTATCQDD